MTDARSIGAGAGHRQGRCRLTHELCSVRQLWSIRATLVLLVDDRPGQDSKDGNSLPGKCMEYRSVSRIHRNEFTIGEEVRATRDCN